MRFTALALMAVLLASSAAAEVAPTEIDIVVSPSTVVLDSEGTWVTVHAEIGYSSVAGLTVCLDGIPVVYTKSDNRGQLVAKFDLDQVKDSLEPGTVTLTLTGLTKTGEAFTGSDSIIVKAGGRR